MPIQPAQGAPLNWRKSSASAGVGECVEVATSGQAVLTRDSRAESGPVLVFTAPQWLRLLQRIKNG